MLIRYGKESTLLAWCTWHKNWSKIIIWGTMEEDSYGSSWKVAEWQCRTTKNISTSILPAKYQDLNSNPTCTISNMPMVWWDTNSRKDLKIVETSSQELHQRRMNIMVVLLAIGETTISRNIWGNTTTFLNKIWRRSWRRRMRITSRYIIFNLGCMRSIVWRSVKSWRIQTHSTWNYEYAWPKSPWIFPGGHGSFQ